MCSQIKYRHIGPMGKRVIAVVGVPGDPNVYYIGGFSGRIWKSNDNGKNCKCMGLEKTGRIGRIIIHPTGPNIVFVTAMGHCYGPQQERGVFRTTDAGKSCERVLFVDENTGCSDIAMDPNNPGILFAGMWQMFISTWGRWSSGPGSGLYISQDCGTTWKHLTSHGLPDTTMGKIAVAIARNNSIHIYALLETEDEELWRSDDGGETFKIFPVVGGDNHDMWIDPLLPDRLIASSPKPLPQVCQKFPVSERIPLMGHLLIII